MHKLMQLFSVSMYFLWFYDYFLTLGDEVRYPHIFRRKCQALTVAQINYAWSGRRSWGEFLPPCQISNSYLIRSPGSIRVVHCCTASQTRPQVVTGLIVLQNRYIPALHVLYKCIVMFHFTKSVSPGP